MKQTIIQFLKNHRNPEGFTPAEIKDQCELPVSAHDIKAILSDLKKEALVVSEKTRFLLAEQRPDLLPKAHCREISCDESLCIQKKSLLISIHQR